MIFCREVLHLFAGASEIDIVLSRTKVLKHDWEGVYEEVKAMKEACGPDVHMKSILAVGDLGSLTNVYKVFGDNILVLKEIFNLFFSKGLTCLYDGWIRFYKDVYRERRCKCHPSSWHRHVQSHT